MHIIKPEQVLLLQQVIQREGRFDNVLALLTGFRLSSPTTLVAESEWVSAVEPWLQGRVLDECWPKTRGEVLVFGEFKAQDPTALHGQVRVQVNQIDKRLIIFPERQWQKRASGQFEPVTLGPLTDLPLTDNHAFGGQQFADNPQGIGYWPSIHAAALAHANPPLALPRIELPHALVQQPWNNELQGVASLLPRPLNHPKRLQYYGIMDEAYHAHDYPGLPKGTQAAFYQMAPADQQIDGLWSPGEPITLSGMSLTGDINSQLPPYRARCFIQGAKEGGFAELPLQLDTLLLFPALDLGLVIFRAVVEVANHRADEFSHYLLAVDHAKQDQQRPLAHYQQSYTNRRGPDRAAYLLKSDDLLPATSADSPAPQVTTQPAKPPKHFPDGSVPLPKPNVHTLNAKLQQAGVTPPKMTIPAAPTVQAISLPEGAQELANQAAAILTLHESLWSDATAELQTLPDLPQLSALTAADSAPQAAANASVVTAIPSLSNQLQQQQLNKALQLAKGHAPLSREAIPTPAAPPSSNPRNAATQTHPARASMEASNAKLYALVGKVSATRPLTDLSGSHSKQWLVDKDCRHLNLSNLTLTDWVFDNCDFTGANFTNTAFERVHFDHSRLDKANFQQACFHECVLNSSQGSDVNWAQFSSQQTHWEDCHFSDSVAYQSQWQQDQLLRCDFTRITWIESRFISVKCTQGQWVQCQFNTVKSAAQDLNISPNPPASATHPALQDCQFLSTHWRRCQFVGTQWHNCGWDQISAVSCAFSGETALFDQGQWLAVDLQECNLTQFHLSRSTLLQCQLADNLFLDAQFIDLAIDACNWQSAQLANSHWQDCTIEHSDFSRANAMGSEWHHCTLQHNRWQGMVSVYQVVHETEFQ